VITSLNSVLIWNIRNTEAETMDPIPATAHSTSESRLEFCLERSKRVYSRLSNICEPTEAAYLDRVCAKFIEEKNKEHLELHLSKVEKLYTSISKYQNQILSLSGMGSAHENVDNMAKNIRKVVGHLEDILCAALLGVDEVEKNWAAGKFAYQTESSG